MILKKPYAILIKYFRIIHLVLSVFIVYSIIKINSLLSFFNNFLSTQDSVIGQNLQGNLFNSLIFVFTILNCIISILLLWLMFKKKKPFRFYLFNSLVCVISLVIFIYSYNFLGKMSATVIDVVNVRVLRDLFIILLSLQSVALLVTFIRTIGFDIKSFEFMKDLQQLEISEEDQEEYEIDFNFDSNERKRKRKKKLRYLKYSYKENKLFINLVIFIIIFLLGFFIYSRFNVYTISQKEGKLISTNYYDMIINNTRLVNTSYNGTKLTDGYLVVVDLSVKTKNSQNRLLVGNFKFQIGDNKYFTTNKYNNHLLDIGNVYNNDILSSEFKNYLLVFEVPKDVVDKDMKLIYYDLNGDIKIKLNPIFDKNDYKEYSLNDEIDVGEYGKVILSAYEIANSFSINYDFCIGDTCHNSVQLLVPSLDKNYDKALVKINGNFTKNSSSNYVNLSDFIRGLGYIEYEIGGYSYISSIQMINNIKDNNSNDIYFEVNKQVMDADRIKLIFNTRNCKYALNLK